MFRKLLAHLQISTIRTKLILVFILVGLVPFIIFAIFAYQTYSGALHNRITAYSMEVVEKMQNQLDNYLKDISSLLEVEDDYYINQSINLIRAGEYSKNRKYIFRLWEEFNNIRQLKSGLKEFSLTFNNGHRLSNYGLYFPDKGSLSALDFKKSGLRVSRPHQDLQGEQVITLSRPLNNGRIRENVIISASVSLDRLQDMIRVRLGEDGYTFIVDDQGRQIFGSGEGILDLDSEFFRSNFHQDSGNISYNSRGQNYILTYATSAVTGWKIISVNQASQITADLNKLKRLTFVILAIILISVIMLIIYLSAFLTNPLRKLQSMTRKAVNNNLDVNIQVRGNDEVARLSRSFNRMLERIKKLVAQNIEEQRQIRDLELKSLHEQIKPHFIYNTLDLIIGYLERDSHSSARASQLIESLGGFFRLSFAQGKEMVNISSELEHIRHYLYIQQQRFRDVFEYVIDIEDEEILEDKIPKLLLQPLVENSIYHGVLEIDSQGLIVIKGYLEGETIVLEIIDNGQGIHPDRLEEIQAVLADGDCELVEGCFGLKNVHQRIQYKFGPEFGLSLDSRPGEKTTVKVRIGIL